MPNVIHQRCPPYFIVIIIIIVIELFARTRTVTQCKYNAQMTMDTKANGAYA